MEVGLLFALSCWLGSQSSSFTAAVPLHISQQGQAFSLHFALSDRGGVVLPVQKIGTAFWGAEQASTQKMSSSNLCSPPLTYESSSNQYRRKCFIAFYFSTPKSLASSSLPPFFLILHLKQSKLNQDPYESCSNNYHHSLLFSFSFHFPKLFFFFLEAACLPTGWRS